MLYTKKANQRRRDLSQLSSSIAILISPSQDHLDAIVGTTTTASRTNMRLEEVVIGDQARIIESVLEVAPQCNGEFRVVELERRIRNRMLQAEPQRVSSALACSS